MQSRVVFRLLFAAVLVSLGVRAQGRVVAAPPRQAASSCLPTATSGALSPAGLVARSNGFGFRLLRTLLTAHPADNTFLSPASVSIALDMTYDGARGNTAAAMARTLGLAGMSQAAVRGQAASLLHQIQASGAHAGLSVADSLWARKGVRFQTAFVRHAQLDYGATVRALDFASPQAPATINRWVSCATDGKIPSIITRIPPRTVLYLLNAVYFHGDWAAPFNPADTRTHPFTAMTGTQVSVPLMSRTGLYSYYRGANFQIVRLPYVGGRFGMVLLAPGRGTPPGAVSRELTAGAWQRWSSQMRQVNGLISLPRFSLQNTFALTTPLASLGMGAAFAEGADFRGLCLPNCRISNVRHRTYLAVNEKGTVAAGATSVGMEPTAVAQLKFQMVLDHPFFLTIEDNATRSILFAGFVANPAA